MNSHNRSLDIDALRFIGISLIILAHVLGSDSLLFQIRSFDVPLMVFVSGLCSADKEIPDYGKYIGHRFLRLWIPVCLFYSVYFLVLFILSRWNTGFTFPSFRELVRTFCCLEGYGWIIRVFFLIALVAPVLIRFEKKARNSFAYLGFIFILLALSAFLTRIPGRAESVFFTDIWQGGFLLPPNNSSILPNTLLWFTE